VDAGPSLALQRQRRAVLVAAVFAALGVLALVAVLVTGR
jgi:hypothetical protein